MAAMQAKLAGVNVVVTRPAHQAEGLCQRIESAGGEAIRFPVIAVEEVADKHGLLAIVEDLATFDIAIFISPNAVNFGLNVVKSRMTKPPQLKIAAVGRSTATVLEKQGWPADIFPSQRYNSEALLALPEFQSMENCKIVIFRGEGGRELLADSLKARGAQVVYAECYRRVVPTYNADILLNQWASDKVHIIIVTSNTGLQNLYDIVGIAGRQFLQKTPLVVISPRMVGLAQQLGFEQQPVVAANASDDALVDAVMTWHSDQQTTTIS